MICDYTLYMYVYVILFFSFSVPRRKQDVGTGTQAGDGSFHASISDWARALRGEPKGAGIPGSRQIRPQSLVQRLWLDLLPEGNCPCELSLACSGLVDLNTEQLYLFINMAITQICIFLVVCWLVKNMTPWKTRKKRVIYSKLLKSCNCSELTTGRLMSDLMNETHPH
jgi:hypothetical protein